LILSVITVALIWLTVRYFGPVAIGAMFAQTLSLIIMIMLGILFLILIVPLRACRMIFMTAVKMVAATIFITTLIAALFQVTFNFATLFTSLLSFNTKIFDPLFQAIIAGVGDRKSTRLNSSHVSISYAVYCLTTHNASH